MIIKPRRASVKPAERRWYWYRIPRVLLTHPPTDLEMFAVFIMTGVIEGAGRQVSQNAFDGAWDGDGAKKIAAEQRHSAEWREDMKRHKERQRQGLPSMAPKRYSTWKKTSRQYTALDTGDMVRQAGSLGFEKHRKELVKLGAEDVVRIKCTRYQLLKWAGLSVGNDPGKVDIALDRLTKPVGTMPPLVLSWKVMESGRLLIKADGEWLRVPFGRCPKPFPHRSATVLWLYLFTRSVNTDRVNRKGTTKNGLCKRLGLNSRYIRRQLDRTLRQIERHYAKFSDRTCLALEGMNCKIPRAYDVDTMDNGLIRFIATPRRLPDEEQLEAERAERQFRKSLDDANSKPRRILKVRPMTTQAQRDKKAQFDKDAAQITKMYEGMRARSE